MIEARCLQSLSIAYKLVKGQALPTKLDEGRHRAVERHQKRKHILVFNSFGSL